LILPALPWCWPSAARADEKAELLAWPKVM
jgi:hypothetical protein